jgi:hypothetical protein
MVLFEPTSKASEDNDELEDTVWFELAGSVVEAFKMHAAGEEFPDTPEIDDSVLNNGLGGLFAAGLFKHKQIEEEVVVLGKEVKAVMLEKEAKLEVESELEAVLLGKDM